MMTGLRFEVRQNIALRRNLRLREALQTLLEEDLYLAQHGAHESAQVWDLLLAIHERKAVGYILFKRDKKEITTSRTFVLPHYRRKGIATEMIKALGQWARKRGFKTIHRPNQQVTMQSIAEKARKNKKKSPFKDIETIFCSTNFPRIKMHLKRKRPQTRRK